MLITIKLIGSPKGTDGKGVHKFHGLNVGGTTTYLHSNRFLTHNGMQKKSDLIDRWLYNIGIGWALKTL